MKTLSEYRANPNRLSDLTHTKTRRALSLGATVVAVLLIVVGVVVVFAFVPGNQLSSLSSHTTTTTSALQAGSGACTQNSIKLELDTFNSVAATSPTVELIQNGNRIAASPISVTAGTQTAGTALPYGLPWSATFNASAYWPLSYTVSNVPASGYTTTGNLGNVVGTVVCNIPSGNQLNTVPYWSQQSTIYKAPASGTSATTNVESVINSRTSQTNSFSAAFPTASAQSNDAYLQVFSTSTQGLGGILNLWGSGSVTRTDYGGINGEPAQSVPVNNGGAVYYGEYAIFSFNQTSIAFSAPGAVPIQDHGNHAVISYAVPLSACQASAASGTSTTNPFICADVSFSVQETIAATGKHVGMVVIFVGPTQLGYIQQFFTAPAVTSFPSAGNAAGIPTGFGGLVPPNSANAQHALIEQYSAVIATY